jgi:hypothetical protein
MEGFRCSSVEGEFIWAIKTIKHTITACCSIVCGCTILKEYILSIRIMIWGTAYSSVSSTMIHFSYGQCVMHRLDGEGQKHSGEQMEKFESSSSGRLEVDVDG